MQYIYIYKYIQAEVQFKASRTELNLMQHETKEKSNVIYLISLKIDSIMLTSTHINLFHKPQALISERESWWRDLIQKSLGYNKNN